MAATLTLSAGSAYNGGTLTWTVAGFTAGEVVSLRKASTTGTVVQTLTANTSGGGSATWTVSGLTVGQTVLVYATGGTSGLSASGGVACMNGAPTLTFASSAAPYDTVGWTVANMTPAKSVTLHWGSSTGVTVATSTANTTSAPYGQAGGDYTLGSASPGTYTLTATTPDGAKASTGLVIIAGYTQYKVMVNGALVDPVLQSPEQAIYAMINGTLVRVR